MSRDRRATVVIGSGIQGLTLALALAGRGVATLVLDRQREPFQGASLRNEGKLHLGFVYALDESGRTTSEMVEGALNFAPLLERWCGKIDWKASRSQRFAYAVMEDSLATPSELESHYESVSTAIEQAGRDFGLNYLGDELDPGFVRGRGEAPGLRSGLSDAWFDTPERSVDPGLLRHHLTQAVAAEPLIEVLTDRHVVSAMRSDSGFELAVASDAGSGSVAADMVVNCAWEGRAALDEQILGPVSGLCYRLKHQVVVRGEGAGELTPLTLVQGPYGDIVPWPNGDVYVSWYPLSRTWFGDSPVENPVPDLQVAAATLSQMERVVPGLKGFEVVDHAPCHIIAPAVSDIDDLASGLHSRHSPGITGESGWWSLAPGKLTTAPLASERCAALITDTPEQI